jgi:hypothetical protein
VKRLFAILSFPGAPWGILKLAVLVAALYLPLRVNRRRWQGGSLLAELAGKVQVRHLLPLLVMPVMATTVYGLAAWLPVQVDTIRVFYELVPLCRAWLAL